MDQPDTVDTLAVEEDQVPANNNNSKEGEKEEEDNDDNEVDNEEQETFVLPAAGPNNNIRYEKRSGLGKRPQR